MTDPEARVAASGLGTGPMVSPEGRPSGNRCAPSPPRLKVPSQVPVLTPDTPMQKLVLPGLVDLTLGNVVVPGRFDPNRIAGFVTRLEDVPASPSAELLRRYGLDQVSAWPVTDDLHVLRFYAHSPQLYLAPFDSSVYQVDLIELPAGTELWRIDSTGEEHRVGAYLHRQVGWISTGAPTLGPAGWNRPPVSSRPTVRRGLIAQYHGADFDADFGPRPGEVTLHPLPGTRPPAEFLDHTGAYALAVAIDELDSLEMLGWRGGWHGLPVELVESSPDHAVIHYIGENGPRAADLGLAEVDYRVWRGCVPRRTLTDVSEQRTTLYIS